MTARLSVLNSCVILTSIICLVNGARILGVFHMPAYSHFQLGDRIFKELAARGHEVTVISPFEMKSPVKNLKHVVLTGNADHFKDIQKNLFKEGDIGIFRGIMWMSIFGTLLTESVLKDTAVQKLLQSNETFDLVIQENFLNEAFVGFSYYYKAPNIVINPTGSTRWANSRMGNPNNPSYVPDIMLSYSSKMNIVQRVCNTLVYVCTELSHHLYTYPKHNQLLQSYFPGAPHLYNLIYNTSLMLLNSQISISSPVPLLPNMIEIGGYHVHPPKPLPEELQEYLDNAQDGFIFFSMGSNLKSRDLPEHTRVDILNALGKLKQKVLWKWEDDILPGQPPNVKLGKWFSQQDILAHPNIKLFITHGGLLSTIEAIYNGVPIIGIPVFGDQYINVFNAENDGYGIGVPFKSLNEPTLSAALNQILYNPKYTADAKRRSQLMHDQTMRPLDRAIYWIEYVIRHQGAPHLKTPALNLHWFQYLLLDVIALISAGVALFIWVLYRILKLAFGKRGKGAIDKKKKRN